MAPIFEILKKLAVIVVISALIVGAITALTAWFGGCMTAPDRENYTTAECYAAADCLYRIKSADEKSPCAFLTEACRDSLKERTRIYRLEYCRDKKPADMTERECRSWLNEK